MSLHADVAVPARDRKRLEHLASYILRPAISLERLEALPDGRLSYRLKTRWRDGTTHILMERRELLERLAPLIPPPRAHQLRYHGILAPCASGRDRVVPGARRIASATGNIVERIEEEAHCADHRSEAYRSIEADFSSRPKPSTTPCVPSTPTAVDAGELNDVQPDPTLETFQSNRPPPAPYAMQRRLPWAKLLQRVFGIQALQCPCGKPMRVLAAITDPTIAKRILECIGLPPRAPPLSRVNVSGFATDPLHEESDADFDQTPPEYCDDTA